MKQTSLTFPEVALIAATRVALGAGIALLLSDCLSAKQRKAAGWAFFLAGATTTIPLVKLVLDKRSDPVESSPESW